MIILKRGDTGIGLRATLSNDEGNVDLTGSEVHFLFGEHKINAEIEDGKKNVLVVFNDMHTMKTGIFDAEFKVRFKDGRVETSPNDSYLKIKIMQDLGGKT